MASIKSVWQIVRRLSGDDAYERYLRHYADYHQAEVGAPLSKAAFFKQWQEDKWNGVKRCC